MTVSQLEKVLTPLSSEKVNLILGFTELDGSTLYNSAATFFTGRIAGIYRKIHSAIRRSVYSPGSSAAVFDTVGTRVFDGT